MTSKGQIEEWLTWSDEKICHLVSACQVSCRSEQEWLSFYVCKKVGLWPLKKICRDLWRSIGPPETFGPSMNSDWLESPVILHLLSTRNDISFVFCIFLWLNSGKTPTNSKFSKIHVIFGFSAFFYLENMYHLYFE